MGIFGDSGIFGKMFDFNRDGKVDCFEQGMEFMFLNEMMKKDKAADKGIWGDPSSDGSDEDL